MRLQEGVGRCRGPPQLAAWEAAQLRRRGSRIPDPATAPQILHRTAEPAPPRSPAEAPRAGLCLVVETDALLRALGLKALLNRSGVGAPLAVARMHPLLHQLAGFVCPRHRLETLPRGQLVMHRQLRQHDRLPRELRAVRRVASDKGAVIWSGVQMPRHGGGVQRVHALPRRAGVECARGLDRVLESHTTVAACEALGRERPAAARPLAGFPTPTPLAAIRARDGREKSPNKAGDATSSWWERIALIMPAESNVLGGRETESASSIT
eukprot:CAMPEP_0181189278 /NCGR_PEP_ID=MMETSP1096-20121128/11576_1 /TAXON_ID=156174 ORGANISM="Chrysochromulina ericina, Strain CCMP281" /NCGR_SAMPLE_ID=MMETSP1096 /ASSEMBLY_ACC=CAM_ASM_000453 /LENGTH=266 /DNA_ID=CAMNT_0023278419 /DNA_START=390 /DNA_END=1187 /DNA_ORIENTATION=-